LAVRSVCIDPLPAVFEDAAAMHTAFRRNTSSTVQVRGQGVVQRLSLVRRPLLTPADMLLCAIPVALFLSIVSLV
jgi:hypothetical protein